MAKLKTPFKDLLPPLSTDEREALKADLKAHGQREAVVVDEEGNVLDGHNRYSILKDKATTKVMKGLTPGEKEAFVFRNNVARRNLSPEQKTEVRLKQKATAEALREEDPKKWTQARVAVALGVTQQCVAKWFSTNTTGCNTSKPDARVKVNPEAKKEIAKRVEAGETQTQVAADYGISQKQASNIVRAEEKAKEKKKKRQANIRKAKKVAGGDELGVYHEPFVECAKRIPDGSLELIFTDPPYDDNSLPMFDDLGKVAFDKLQEGGSVLTFFGQHRMDQVMDKMTSAGLKFLWPLCIYHTGTSSRMNFFGIVVKWKPVLWFVKGNNRLDTSVFVDDAIMSTQEKDTHPWQQSVVEASYYIEKLSAKGSLIFDPFCGGGTTAVAAKKCGRLWITCDVDAEYVTLSRGRIADGT